MKKLLSLICILFCYIAHSHAQTFVWAKGFSTNGSAIYTTRPAIDDSGNVYLSGQFTGTVDFDPGPGVANFTSFIAGSMFIVKLNAAGNYVWAKSFSPVATGSSLGAGLAVDHAGNVVIGGYFSGTVDFDPGPGTLSTTAIGSTDAYLLKLSPNGSLVWFDHIGGASAETILWLTIDDNDNVIATGHFNGTVDFDPGPGTYNLTSAGDADVLVLKLNNAAGLVWARQMGGIEDDWGYGVCTDKMGNIYTTGYFLGTADFDPGAASYPLVTSVYYRDIFVSKLDSSGNFKWAGHMGDPTTDDIGSGVAVDAAGNVYSTGSFRGNGDFDPGAGTFYMTSTGGTFDGYISKLDSTGAFVWVKQIGGSDGSDGGRCITLDSFGNIYSIGAFIGTVDIDPGAGSHILVSASSSEYDAYLSKLDIAGALVWAGQVGGPGSDPGFAISIDKHGNIYSSGMFEATADLDPCATVDTMNVAIAGLYVNKLTQCWPYTPYVYISTLTSDHADTLTAVTNVSNGSITYQWYVNGIAVTGATSAVYVITTATDDTVTCSIVTSDTCASSSTASSNGVILTIFPEAVTQPAHNALTIDLYPNPNTGSFRLKGKISGNSPLNYHVIDITGRSVSYGSITPQNGAINEHIQLPGNTPPGNYILKAVTANNTDLIKFTIE